MAMANIIQIMSMAMAMSMANNANSKGPPQIQEEHII